MNKKTEHALSFTKIIDDYRKSSVGEGAKYLNTLDLSFKQAQIIKKMIENFWQFDKVVGTLGIDFDNASPPGPNEADAVRATRSLFRRLEEKGFIQKQLADKIGSSQQVISRYARFEREMPLAMWLALQKISLKEK